MSNVWVGNLPASMSQNALLDLFTSYGAVTSCKVINKPRGTCGLVLFGDVESASRAVQGLNGQLCEDKPLIVKLAKDKAPAGLAYPGVTRTATGTKRKYAAETNVWIGNLPATLGQDDLSALMSSYGNVTSVKVLSDKRTGQPGGAALVNFSSPQEAAAAMTNLEGTLVGDSSKPIVIRHSQPKVPALGGRGRPVRARGTNIWVGNIPKHYTDAMVSEVFSAYGPVTSVKVLKNRVTKQAEGSAMVNFATTQGANAALEAVAGFALEEGGAPLVVKLASRDVGTRAAVTRAARASAGTVAPTLRRPRNSSVGSVPGIPTNLWVGNLPSRYGPSEVQGLFQQYGRITSVKVLVDRTGRSRSKAAMVNFSNATEAALAIRKMSGVNVPGSKQPLIVKYSSRDFGTAGGASAKGSGLLRTAVRTPTLASYPSKGAVVPGSATDNLWVGNLPINWGEADVKSLFATYGRVLSVAVFPPKRTGQCTGAMVRFASLSEATGALQSLNGVSLETGAPRLIIKFSAKGSPGALSVAQGLPRATYHPYSTRRGRGRGRGRPY